VEGWEIDGNNVLDVYAAVKIAVDRARNGEGPFMLIAETFRMGGHATHDEREARETFPAELFERWGKRDPIGMYEAYLIESGLDLERGTRARRGPRERNAALLRRIEERVIAEVDRAAQEALSSARDCMPKPESAAEGAYAQPLEAFIKITSL
jgi:TPP-dependent pyruvate/acetoin dehydrogenase alpha subunit